MTPAQAEYADLLARVGIGSTNDAARFFGINRTTAKRFAEDPNGPPPFYTMMLRFLVSRGYSVVDVEREVRAWQAGRPK